MQNEGVHVIITQRTENGGTWFASIVVGTGHGEHRLYAKKDGETGFQSAYQTAAEAYMGASQVLAELAADPQSAIAKYQYSR